MENIVTSFLSRGIALLGWTAVMAIVWALFVPKGLPVGAFALLSLSVPVALEAGSVLWRAQRPSPSVGQILADLEAPPTGPQGPR
jgi:hypothetical protein